VRPRYCRTEKRREIRLLTPLSARSHVRGRANAAEVDSTIRNRCVIPPANILALRVEVAAPPRAAAAWSTSPPRREGPARARREQPAQVEPRLDDEHQQSPEVARDVRAPHHEDIQAGPRTTRALLLGPRPPTTRTLYAEAEWRPTERGIRRVRLPHMSRRGATHSVSARPPTSSRVPQGEAYARGLAGVPSRQSEGRAGRAARRTTSLGGVSTRGPPSTGADRNDEQPSRSSRPGPEKLGRSEKIHYVNSWGSWSPSLFHTVMPESAAVRA
jgi:hypothetical protein